MRFMIFPALQLRSACSSRHIERQHASHCRRRLPDRHGRFPSRALILPGIERRSYDIAAVLGRAKFEKPQPGEAGKLAKAEASISG